MAGPTIDTAFVKQYEREVHEAYQRMGSKCRGTVRTKSGIVGESTTFQKVGKGAAVQKARHGEIPPMNLDHSNVTATLADYFAGEYIDKFDELKINHDERQVAVNAAAYAQGRKTDEIIIDQATTTTTSEGGTGLISVKRILDALEALQANDVPMDGEVYGFLTTKAWAELLNSAEEFKNADYAVLGTANGAYRARDFLDVKWMQHTGLPNHGTSTAECLIWHKSALGHAIAAEAETDIQWIGPRHAHFVNVAISQGGVLIDTEGVVKIPVDDTASLS